MKKGRSPQPHQGTAENKRASLSPQSDFDWARYIPYCLVRTQLWMHRVLAPESAPSVKNIAKISKTESRVILLVALNESITPSQIADEMGFDRSVVTRAITTLTGKGLIVSTTLESDQRSKSVHLTGKGMQLYNALTVVMHEFSDYLDSQLTGAEKKTLISTLDKLLQGAKDYATK